MTNACVLWLYPINLHQHGHNADIFHLIPTPTNTKEKTKCASSFLVLPFYRFKILSELNKITDFIGDVFQHYFKK
jgi:hypothetical protein